MPVLDHALELECRAAALLADYGAFTRMRVELPAQGGNATDVDALGSLCTPDGIRHIVASVTTERSGPYQKLLGAMGLAYYLQSRHGPNAQSRVIFAHGGEPGLVFPTDDVAIHQLVNAGNFPNAIIEKAISDWSRSRASGRRDAYLRAFKGLQAVIQDGIHPRESRLTNLCERHAHMETVDGSADCADCLARGSRSRVHAGLLGRALFSQDAWLSPTAGGKALMEAHMRSRRLYRDVAREVASTFTFVHGSLHPKAVHAGSLQTLGRLAIMNAAAEEASRDSADDSQWVTLGDPSWWRGLQEAIGLLRSNGELIWRFARIMQHWVFVYGGFFIKSRREQEMAVMAREISATPEEIHSALEVVDCLFPSERGFIQDMPEVDVQYLVLTPLWIRGLGVLSRAEMGWNLSGAPYSEWSAAARAVTKWPVST